jgi:hypothetical protein
MADQVNPNVPEEELDIAGSNEPPRKPPQAGKNAAGDDDSGVNKIEVSVSDLSGLVGPGATNEEFVNQLLAAPDEKLIPWEECYLPSRGLYYGWPDGMIQVKAMGQVAEKILSTQRLAQTGQSMDYLFRECCRFPQGFDPLDLLLGDRIFLLYFLRGITHGQMYEFAITCPNSSCEAVSTHAYDLNDLASTIVSAKPELGREPFKVVLPYISKAAKRDVWVGVRFLRAADANDMLAKKKARKKLLAKPGGVRTGPNRGGPLSRLKGAGVDPRGQAAQNQQIDDTISENLEKIIVNVMGVGDLFTVRSFIAKMHAQDAAAVREWLRENTPGIDNTVTVSCPECSHEFTVELPITESFFRPAKG